MAREALSRAGIDGLDVDSILPFCRMMLDHEMHEIELIASHLLVHPHQLDYEAAVRLVQQA
jgi:hypothetical protein